MKKLLAIVLAVVMVLTVMAVASADDEMRVAMITDYGDITDQSFNQTTYEAAKAWCEANGIDFTYYKPAGDSTAERADSVRDQRFLHVRHIAVPVYHACPAGRSDKRTKQRQPVPAGLPHRYYPLRWSCRCRPV